MHLVDRPLCRRCGLVIATRLPSTRVTTKRASALPQTNTFGVINEREYLERGGALSCPEAAIRIID